MFKGVKKYKNKINNNYMNIVPDDPFIKQVEELSVGDYVKEHYKKCIQQGGFCRRGIDWMVKILNQPPKKM